MEKSRIETILQSEVHTKRGKTKKYLLPIFTQTLRMLQRGFTHLRYTKEVM